ncbi:hypothetical protein DFJ58DRAFT_478671 [Suillus subalutaceus]|uniref:uncharacterized protein n=1 Tax=Suillus subalutaceus TaxID=48586 RepID=UPI001B8771F2|nr:uncharacterized protein DFJ58DRAFT_478671 [Suillus subalutaceus]KAG1814932.1 hypothetical protein DFJ58DRAFT_478671 [Suillus subalutaceus]
MQRELSMKTSLTELSRWSERRSSRPAPFNTAGMSHVYTFLSSQPVASSFPSDEKETLFMKFVWWRGELMGWPLSRFHNCVVLSDDVLARMGPFGDIAMAKTVPVCPSSNAICFQFEVFHVLIERSDDPDISVFRSKVQAKQNTGRLCPLRVATNLACLRIPDFDWVLVIRNRGLVASTSCKHGHVWRVDDFVHVFVPSLDWTEVCLSLLHVPTPLQSHQWIRSLLAEPSRLQHTDHTVFVCPIHFAITLPVSNVPQSHSAVLTSANNFLLPVRRQCHRPYSAISVPPVVAYLFPALQVPYPQRTATRTGHDPLSVWQMYDASDPTGVNLRISDRALSMLMSLASQQW